MGTDDQHAETERLGILPLRNSVLFPMSVVPINVGRPRSVRLVESLVDRDSALVGVLTQRDPDTVEPTFDDLYKVGTLARVVKVIRLNASSYSVVLNGLGRFQVVEPSGLEPHMRAVVKRLNDPVRDAERLSDLVSKLRTATREVLGLMPDLPKETTGVLDNVHDPGALADLIASSFPEEHASIQTRQQILEALNVEQRLKLVLQMVLRQLEVLKVRDEISSLVTDEIGKSQREYVLRQQLKAIREELGEAGEEDEIEELHEKVARVDMSEEALKAARKQLSRMSGMQPQSSEYQVARSYVEWLTDLPWARRTPDRLDVAEVRRCLDEDHYGLSRVKKRIVEFSAIRQLTRDTTRGPILLFLGPPGVGKTSLGRSIARAMGRRYGRIALGGVRDEAEIRGHRRTYVGALPGRIIQALKKTGSRNPVLVLDEVDKMGADMRGDPAAALLEVLDPAQNDSFVDHYIGVPFDLSEVVFLATANYWHTIPEALRDRMELIEVPGYTRAEKTNIAKQFLVPKQLKEHGLTGEQLEMDNTAIECLIDHYTREAGVRGLEREIAAVCRNVTVRLVEGEPAKEKRITPAQLEEQLGPRRYHPELIEKKLAPGVAVGIGVTPSGGELLFIEATKMPGKGRIRVTGSMRKVMEEAAHTAVSFARSRSDRLGLDPEWLKKIDLHLHIPRGGGSYDAASSGVAMFVAVASLILHARVRSDVAVVGEITLRGRVLPISGAKAMVLAAHRSGVKEVVLPARNACDLDEVPPEVLQDLIIHEVERVDSVLPLVLENPQRDPETSRSTSTPGSLAHP